MRSLGLCPVSPLVVLTACEKQEQIKRKKQYLTLTAIWHVWVHLVKASFAWERSFGLAPSLCYFFGYSEFSRSQSALMPCLLCHLPSVHSYSCFGTAWPQERRKVARILLWL